MDRWTGGSITIYIPFAISKSVGIIMSAPNFEETLLTV